MNKELLELQEVVNIFLDIKKVSSRTSKESLLKKHQDNTLFREMINFLYNPYVLTGIKTKKLVKFSNFRFEDKNESLKNIREAIGYLSIFNTGADRSVQVIADFINQHDDIHSNVHDFLQDFFTKDFKCGLTSSTINKVWKNEIPEFKVMLAKKYEDEQHKLKGDFGVTVKLDGIRCTVIKQGDSVKFFTRKGQPIEMLVELEEDFGHLPNDMVYDGELILVNEKGLPSDELFRATQKVVRKDGVKRNVEFHIFDLLPIDEFIKGKSKKKYFERMYELHKELNLEKTFFIERVDILYFGDDKSQINSLLEQVIMLGREGIMVNDAKGHYVSKRSDALLKVKKMHTIDLKVVGMEEGTGKNKDKLGALIVDYKGYEVGVGSGFTDEDRIVFWNNPMSIIDTIVEVQYFEESSNQDGGISLRFPVFKCVRFDKNEVSYE